MTSIVTTPADLDIVVPLETLRQQCRIDAGLDDALLAIWRAAAVGFAEHYTSRSIGQQTRELPLQHFPACAIALPMGPVASITSVKYIDVVGVEQTVSSGAYELDVGDGHLYPAYGTAWPAVRAQRVGARVAYVCGATLDPPTLQAILLLVGHADKNREAVGSGTIFTEVPLGIRAMLETAKDYR